MVLLRIQDAGSFCPLLCGVRRVANAGVRSPARTVLTQRSADGSAHLALFFPRRREVLDLDRLSENPLPRRVGHQLHRGYRQQPSDWFRRTSCGRGQSSYQQTVLLRRPQRRPLLLEAVHRWHIHDYRLHRPRPGPDATYPELQELPRVAEEHDSEFVHPNLRHRPVSRIGYAALHVCRRQPEPGRPDSRRRPVRQSGMERRLSALYWHHLHHRADSFCLFCRRLRPDGAHHLVHHRHPEGKRETKRQRPNPDTQAGTFHHVAAHGDCHRHLL